MLAEQEQTALRKWRFFVARRLRYAGVAIQNIGEGVGAGLSPKNLAAESLLRTSACDPKAGRGAGRIEGLSRQAASQQQSRDERAHQFLSNPVKWFVARRYVPTVTGPASPAMMTTSCGDTRKALYPDSPRDHAVHPQFQFKLRQTVGIADTPPGECAG